MLDAFWTFLILPDAGLVAPVGRLAPCRPGCRRSRDGVRRGWNGQALFGLGIGAFASGLVMKNAVVGLAAGDITLSSQREPGASTDTTAAAIKLSVCF